MRSSHVKSAHIPDEVQREQRPAAAIKQLLWPTSYLVAAVALLLCCRPSGGAGSDATTVGVAQVNNNLSGIGGRPYWHRPGCHQVGHTRTISIPGCVKFNLSTNACRGFCLSFSIPATEDIGPPAAPSAVPLDGGSSSSSESSAGGDPSARTPPSGGALSSPLDAGTMDTAQLAAVLSGQALGSQQQQPLIITRRTVTDKTRGPLGLAAALLRGTGNNNNNDKQPESSTGSHGGLQMSDFLHLAGQTKSPLAGAVGDLSDRRDVISVGQCCNMMETEDVTINLRCGLNETRKLVFKSAKSCECFFCKHF